MIQMNIVLIIAAVIIAMAVIILIIKAVAISAAETKAAKAEAEACAQAKPAVLQQQEKINQSMNRLRGMIDQYWVDDLIIIHEKRLKALDNDLYFARTVVVIEEVADEYREVQANLDEYCNTPELTLKPKFYDVLTDKVLQFPVKLKINHPEKGELFLMVNPEAAERYARWGSAVFNFGIIPSRSEGHCSLVKGAGLSGEYEDGFAALAFSLVHELIYDKNRRIPNDRPVLPVQDSASLGQYYCYGQTIREVVAVPSLDPMSDENAIAMARADAEAEQFRIKMALEAAEADRLRAIEMERLAEKEQEELQWKLNQDPFPDDDPDAPYPW